MRISIEKKTTELTRIWHGSFYREVTPPELKPQSGRSRYYREVTPPELTRILHARFYRDVTPAELTRILHARFNREVTPPELKPRSVIRVSIDR